MSRQRSVGILAFDAMEGLDFAGETGAGFTVRAIGAALLASEQAKARVIEEMEWLW